MTLITAATGPAAEIVSEYSPSPRHVALAELQGVVVPSVNRGSKAHDPPAWTSVGATNVCDTPIWVGVAISWRNVRLGRTAAVPTFCTTIVLTRPTPFAFFAA